MLIGTHTSDNDQNYLQIATVQLPRPDLAADSRKFDEERGGMYCSGLVRQISLLGLGL
jgi:hypothetical protein